MTHTPRMIMWSELVGSFDFPELCMTLTTENMMGFWLWREIK